MAGPIYLDYAAATPTDGTVIAAMQPYFSEEFYNPSALYLAAKKVKQDISAARQNVSRIIGAKPSEIIFTAGGTEANNLAIHGIMAAYPQAHIVVSAIEHESVMVPAQQYDHTIASVNADGRLNLESLKNAVHDKTVLISVMHANNEIGTIQPLREIAELIANIKSERSKTGNNLPLYFHTDAAQATAYLDIHVHSLGVDLMTLNGGKIYGPKQSGLLYIKTGIRLASHIQGGGQERNIRSGTENVAGIIGFVTALEIVSTRKKTEVRRLKELQKLFIDECKSLVPQANINGSLKHRLPNNIHITIPGVDNERLLMELDEQGIMCATGSACSASNDKPSHVLAALGMSDTDARSSLRFTMGIGTTDNHVRRVVSTLAQLVL